MVAETRASRSFGTPVRIVGGAAERRDGEPVDLADTEGECPVCGDEDCQKVFHVHLSPPWR